MIPSDTDYRIFKDFGEELPGTCIAHYENMPVQYTEIFKVVKMKTFGRKFFIFFLIFAQNIDCGLKLEPPLRGGSDEYPQSMFWSKNKKKLVYPCKPHFHYINVG